MRQIDWYFDYVSPFSYLASESLQRLPVNVEMRPQPVLFAGLLKHWHTKGPAEIAPMRRFTFRQIQWLAQRDGIRLRFPPAHPFNPLKLLRLGIALGGDIATVQRIFRFVWAEGGSADDAAQWRALTDAFEIDAKIDSDPVKQQLRHNTESAIARGVFGVPSFVIDDEIFWGYDAMDFLIAYLDDPSLLLTPAMQAVDSVYDPLS